MCIIKKGISIFIFLTLIIVTTGCGKEKDETNGTSSDKTTVSVSKAKSIDTTDMFTDNDYDEDYDESKSAVIKLKDSSATCESDAVKINKGTVTLTDEGTYIVSGELDDGMLVVDADKQDKLQIVLKDVSITSKTSAPIYVKQAEKVFITLADKTTNKLVNGGKYTAIDDNNIDGVIFSKDDLTINGKGTLVIDSPTGHGIVCKDDLVVTNGVLEVEASSHGLSAKGSIRIGGGEATIKTDKDGIHAENTEDTEEGYVYIAKGNIKIESEGDGVSASSNMQIDDGEFDIVTAGGSANAKEKSESSRAGEFRGGFKDKSETTSTTDEDTASTKGIKAAGNLVVNGGTFTLDTVDDTIHSNKSIAINDGTYSIKTGDDGVHADENLTVADGKIDISKSYEGLEGMCIDIDGGDINLVSSDDGLNAAGGTDESGFGGNRGNDMFASASNSYLYITGGKTNIDASGDGVDSNGIIVVSGGETYVAGPNDGGNSAMDCNGSAKVTGGIFIASGSSGMASSFGEESTQGAMMVSINASEGKNKIELLDSKDKSLLTWTTTKGFDSVIISCPDIKKGSEYTVKVGDESVDVKMDSIVYGSGSGRGAGGKGGMKGEGGFKGKGRSGF